VTPTRVDAAATGAPPGSTGAGPASAALLRRIAESPGAPLGAVVVGPGGTGKTTLLDAVDRAYTAAGVPVVRVTVASVPPDPPDPSVVVLVDDAHALDDAALDRLRAVADDPAARLVVAHRPWPRSPAGWWERCSCTCRRPTSGSARGGSDDHPILFTEAA
jgi:hypothetical protein